VYRFRRKAEGSNDIEILLWKLELGHGVEESIIVDTEKGIFEPPCSEFGPVKSKESQEYSEARKDLMNQANKWADLAPRSTAMILPHLVSYESFVRKHGQVRS
jgi:hypothetical protein